MSWVNLDDVYVNKTGDSIAGNLSVGGTLTINNAKGNGGTYNVANEITTLRDSVSQCKPQYKIYAGSKVINTTQSWGTLFTKDEFISSFGRGFNASKDSISVMNGDAKANNITVFGISYYPQDGKLVVALSANGGGAFRINYIVVLAE